MKRSVFAACNICFFKSITLIEVQECLFGISGVRLLNSNRLCLPQAQFFGNYKDSEDKEVEVEDASAEAFKIFIDAAYTRSMVVSQVEDCSLLLEFKYLSSKYMIDSLTNEAAKVAERLFACSFFFKRDRWISCQKVVQLSFSCAELGSFGR